MILQVECNQGMHGDPEPNAFLLGYQRLQVVQILDRWIARDHSYFKVEASDDNIYIVRHDLNLQQWELTLFQATMKKV